MKMKEIRKNLYEIENKKNILTPKINETEKNFIELEKNFFRMKKYSDYDDIKYKEIRDVRIFLIYQLINNFINQ